MRVLILPVGFTYWGVVMQRSLFTITPGLKISMATVFVIGGEENLTSLGGAGQILGKKELEDSHVFTVNEALRKVPGVTLWGDGTVTVNGKKVTKVFVNGKE